MTDAITMNEIPEFPELVGNFGAMAVDGLNMLAGDDAWVIIAIYIYENAPV